MPKKVPSFWYDCEWPSEDSGLERTIENCKTIIESDVPGYKLIWRCSGWSEKTQARAREIIADLDAGRLDYRKVWGI